MIDARLQYGPFDGHEGQVPDGIPLALDVTRCNGCGCGRPIHYRTVMPDAAPNRGYSRYDLIEVNDDGALYRHADTLDPLIERVLEEAATR